MCATAPFPCSGAWRRNDDAAIVEARPKTLRGPKLPEAAGACGVQIGVTGYIARRILAVIPVMTFVALFVFLILRLAPGDPAAIIAGDLATPEQLASIRQSLGLDRPLAVQFALWLGHILQGDFGVSHLSGIPVTQLIAQRLAPSVHLALITTLFSVLVAVPLGAWAAWLHNGLPDRAITNLCVVGYSMPFFVLAYVLILLLAVEAQWLPVQGYRSPSDGFEAFAVHHVLPVLTLSVPMIAIVARATRASLLDVLGEDHVRTARAKGLPALAVIVNHGLRNAAVPIVTVIANLFALLIGGVVVTESIFNLPGIGRLTVDAVLARDFPVIQGLILLASGFYVLLNLAVDLVYLYLDPRIAYR